MRQYAHAIAEFAVSCLIVFMLASCDKDCPVCPPPAVEPVSDYNIYISGTSAHAVYVYNTASKTITDTIPLPGSYYTTDIGVSGDGKYLLVISTPSAQESQIVLAIIDVETKDTLNIITGLTTSFHSSVEVSNNGQYIAVFDTKNMTFLDGRTFEILYSDTLRVHYGRFLPDDSRFYFSRSGASQGYIDMTQNYTCSFFRYTDDYGYSPTVWAIQPALQGDAIYMFVRYSQTSNWLISYRPALDSTGIWRFMGPPGGDLRISPDGKNILASDPGFITIDQMGSQMLIAVDVANDGITIISPGYTDDGTYGLLAGDIAFTPDNRYAAIACEAGTGFGLLDMKTLRYVDVLRSPYGGATMDLVACQKIIK